MWHRLALALGSTVTELRERMPYREYVDWMALWSIEPWGDTRGDMHAALIASILANAHRDRKRRAKPFNQSDFMPNFWRTTNAMAHRGQDLAQKMMAIFGPMAGNKRADG